MAATPLTASLDVSRVMLQGLFAMVGAFGGLTFVWQARRGVFETDYALESLIPLMAGLAIAGVFATVAIRALGLIRRFPQGAVVTVNGAGVLDRRLSPEPIPYAEIESARLKDFGRSAVIGNLRDEDIQRRAQPVVVLSVKGFGEVTISPVGLDRSADEILAAIESYRGRLN